MKSSKVKVKRRGPYKQYWFDAAQAIPRQTKHWRTSLTPQHDRNTMPLTEESSSHNSDQLDIPIHNVPFIINNHETAASSQSKMSVDDDDPPLLSDEEPNLYTGNVEEDHQPIVHNLEHSFREQETPDTVDLNEQADLETDSPVIDNSFDDEFCSNFNVDEDYLSEDETCRFLLQSQDIEQEIVTHSTPSILNNDPQPSDDESSSDSDEELAIAPQLHLTTREKIKILLLLATKRRHNLSYTAAENIMEFSHVLSEEESTAFLPTKHVIKKAIDLYSFGLTEHHICPKCSSYIGVVVQTSFYCAECEENFNTSINRTSGNMFLYLSLEEQLRALLEFCISKETIIDSRTRVKINKHNYEDLMDGTFYKKNIPPEFLSLNIFIDGLQIGSTTKTSAWPVLVSLNELPLHLRRKYLMMASVWLSKKKPKCNEYLKPFVEECRKLETLGVRYQRDGEILTQKFKICVCISDSIARPTLRNSHQFNGVYGCGLCYHPGFRLPFGRGHVRSYSTKTRSYPLRTHDETMNYARRAEQTGAKHVKGIKGRAILSTIPGFNIITQLDPDSFHCIVNVAKRFSWLWLSERFSKKAFNIHERLPEVDERLMKITPTTDVARFRSLKERADYRGHEWYHWVMLYSIPCLKNILPLKYLNHWSHLVCGLTLLMQNSVAKSERVYGNRHLSTFVEGIDDLYGAAHVTFSCHLVTHLAQSVQDFGQLCCHSAYIYEAANAEIKNLVKSSNGAIFQICKGIQLKVAVKKCEFDVRHEMNSNEIDYLNKMSSGIALLKPHCTVEDAGLLGRPETKVLKPDVSRAMRRAGVIFDETIPHAIYLRCNFNNEIFHSTKYVKASKQNNSVAILDDNSIFIIDSFVVLSSGDKCFALGHFIMEEKRHKLCDPIPPHLRLLKCDPEGTLRCIPIGLILSKLFSFTVDLSDTVSLRLAYVNVLSMEMLR